MSSNRKTRDTRRAARLFAAAEHDLRRVLRTMQVAAVEAPDEPACGALVSRLTDMIRAAKTTSAMLLKSADASDEAESVAKRAERRTTKR